MPESSTTSPVFIELGCAIVGLAVLARVANRLGYSAIPLYLIAGLVFGNGGLASLNFSKEFVHQGADIGVLLLLFMLGLEYTGSELKQSLRKGVAGGLVDFVFNFPPGLMCGLWLGWKPLPSVLFGGVTYISSSGIAAKVLTELRRLTNAETPTVLSILVMEDLAMALYLPLVAVLLTGGAVSRIAMSVGIAIFTVSAVLFVAIRFGERLSRFASHQSDEIILLTILGTVLLVAGVSEKLHVSAAIGAFLVGIAVSGPIAEQSHRLIAPLRDLFAATFFFFFGLEIDPSSLPPTIPVALTLGAITTLTKLTTGYIATRRIGLDRRSCLRAGGALVARGEFSIVIAGLGVATEPALGPLSASYVLLLAIAGPVIARVTK